ncbi:putative U6 snRNA-associated Sm-like protein LSm4 [Colletotrichum trifolii]|uniref:Putative U6 snRNA-associated Sm-like protein LSm4 n=1 Tax=Colletotrichum trifolii TaxID=5466 RepID=A0A4R8RLJ6_COLTR|nr:putative U6 snRNA-associated Sm-like protein LSm4 [Colletotrichum trifolii]
MRLLRLIYLLALWCLTASSAIEEPPKDALKEMGYDVQSSGEMWKIRRNGVLINKFEVEHYRYQLTIREAWNKIDSSPRLRLHQIMALVWERSGAAISQLSVVRVERIANDETKDAMQEARQAANVRSSESLTVGPGETGWAELKASPFYRHSLHWSDKNALALQGEFLGRLGMIQVIRYTESPVVPYDELLVVPGFSKYNRTNDVGFTEEKENVRRDWNIPKHLARFDWIESDNGETAVKVYPHDTTGDVNESAPAEKPGFQAKFKPDLLSGLPFSTNLYKVLGINATLAQPPLPYADSANGELPGADHWAATVPGQVTDDASLGIFDLDEGKGDSVDGKGTNALPLGLLNAAQGHPMLVELKNGETLNGHLVMCDTWMNLTLKEVVQTSPEGDKFVKIPEVYVKGNNIKYLRVPDDIIDLVKENQQNQQGGFRGGRGGQRGDHGGRGGDRGRGRGQRGGRGRGRGQ